MAERVFNNIDVHPAAWIVICIAALAAAIFDVRKHRIPNPLTASLCIAGLLWAGMTGGWWGVAESFTAIALLGFPFVLLYIYARGGAGDAKLMMAVGPWVGLTGGALVLASVAVTGLLFATFYAAIRGQSREVAGNLGAIGVGAIMAARRVIPWRDMPRMPQPGALQRMPYGPAICAGVWLSAGGTMLWQAPM